MSLETHRPGIDLHASGPAERARFSRLLLVEDNESLRQTLTGILEDEGFEVTGCATGTEALQQMQQEQQQRVRQQKL